MGVVAIPPLLLILVPMALVLKQPDLGTALLLALAFGGCVTIAFGLLLGHMKAT